MAKGGRFQMDYQEIVNAYKTNRLNIDSFKKGLEIAKPLSGRPKYRAVSLSGYSFNFHIRLLEISNYSKDSQEVMVELEKEIDMYFMRLVQLMKDCRAWKITGLVAQNYTKEKFDELNFNEKIDFVIDLNKKYSRFLDTQKIADLRDCVVSLRKLSDDDEKIKKLCFLKLMFMQLKRPEKKEDADKKKLVNEPEIITELYLMDDSFLTTLVSYRREKKFKSTMEEYMSRRRKSIQHDFKTYSKLFSQADFKMIAENIDVASNILKISPRNIIEVYNEMSESEAEQEYLKGDIKNLESARELYLVAYNSKVREDAQKTIREKTARQDKDKEERKKRLEALAEKSRKEAEARIKQREKEERDRIIGKTEGYTGKMEEGIAEIQNTPTAKEQVKPLIFAWFEKEDVTLTRRIGSKRLTEFFEKIKRIEAETGIRVSLFMITNASREVTVKRLDELLKKAKAAGLPRLVEGALGGYSSFRVDKDKKITDIAKMSPENRKKIMLLLSKSYNQSLPVELIDNTDTEYLRYQFRDRRDKSVDKRYLNITVNRLLSDERVSRQPLKFLPYIEDKKAGIDVVLESQLKGLSQIPEYYKSKYYISPGKTMKVSIEEIDAFINPDRSDKDGIELE